MLGGWPAGGIWLSTEPADMRRSFDGLSALVATHLGENPASGRWYVFVNRRRTIVKVLGFEHGGYFVWAKRLEQGLFASPRRWRRGGSRCRCPGPNSPRSWTGLTSPSGATASAISRPWRRREACPP